MSESKGKREIRQIPESCLRYEYYKGDCDTSHSGSPCNIPLKPGKETWGTRLEKKTETIKATVMLRSARISRRFLECWENLPLLRHQWKPPLLMGWTCKEIIIIIIIIIIIRKTTVWIFQSANWWECTR